MASSGRAELSRAMPPLGTSPQLALPGPLGPWGFKARAPIRLSLAPTFRPRSFSRCRVQHMAFKSEW